MGTPDAAVCDKDVDVADFLLDVRDGGLEGVLRGDVTGYWDDVAVGRLLGGSFQHVLAAADDVDFVGTVQSESLGHHETDAAATAGDDGDEAFDIEEVCCFEGRHGGDSGTRTIRPILFSSSVKNLRASSALDVEWVRSWTVATVAGRMMSVVKTGEWYGSPCTGRKRGGK